MLEGGSLHIKPTKDCGTFQTCYIIEGRRLDREGYALVDNIEILSVILSVSKALSHLKVSMPSTLHPSQYDVLCSHTPNTTGQSDHGQ